MTTSTTRGSRAIPTWEAVTSTACAPGSTQAQVPAYGHDMAGMQLNAAAEVSAAGIAGAGPVTELDKTFLVKVRQAGLWEMPAVTLVAVTLLAMGAHADDSPPIRPVESPRPRGWARAGSLLMIIALALTLAVPWLSSRYEASALTGRDRSPITFTSSRWAGGRVPDSHAASSASAALTARPLR